jgi:hypothetical protein
MTKKIILTCPLLIVAVLASGCNRQPTIPDVQMGDSVRRVMNSQINDYEAAIHPNPDAVEGSDPYRLEAVLNAHREDIANAQEVQQPVTISIGSQQ